MQRGLTELDDDTLVRRAVDGDGACYAAIVERHYEYTLRLAWRGAGNREDAEEIVQELWGERLPRRLHLFDHRARFTTWLARVTINLTRDRLRSRHPTSVIAGDEQAAPERPELDFDLFVESLDPVEAFIAEARFRFDLELEPIGELCGLSTHQVKYRVAGIKQAYRRFVALPVEVAHG